LRLACATVPCDEIRHEPKFFETGRSRPVCVTDAGRIAHGTRVLETARIQARAQETLDVPASGDKNYCYRSKVHSGIHPLTHTLSNEEPTGIIIRAGKACAALTRQNQSRTGRIHAGGATKKIFWRGPIEQPVNARLRAPPTEQGNDTMSITTRRAFARTLLLAAGLVLAGACDNAEPTATVTPPQSARLDIDPTAWYVIRNVSTNKVMDVENAGCCNGYWIHQWTYENRSNQQWQIVPVGSGYYKVVARHSGRVLDVEGASTSDGARVHQWGYDGSTNQQFAFYLAGSSGNTYYIVARHSQKALEVNGGPNFTGNINDNGVGIRQYSQVSRGVWRLELVQ
jgi:hypothetical protein